ncbi:MAG: type II secretion system protein GspF [Rhodocyclales bacterium GT-UBC]|nr:MAG: type II secretion system protein GspF [Rhodocyclales bacterium GT-UBC]
MTAFRYRAVDLDGKEISGILEADTLRLARHQLRARSLFALDVSASREPADASRSPRRHTLGNAELCLLTRQWATLLEAGVPVERSLTALGEQYAESSARQPAGIPLLLAAIRSELLAGHPLHVSLARFPQTFSPLYRALVAAGEQSGQLAGVMLRLADNLESSSALRQKLMQALIYPVLVSLVALAVVIGLMTYVVPQVVAVFQHGQQTLPLLTRWLMACSDLLRATWPLLLGLAGLALWGGRRAWRIPALRHRLQLRLMSLPAVGRLLVSLDSARLAQTLSILVGSGVPLLAALEAGPAVIWLMPLKVAVGNAITAIGEGLPLSKALGREQVFPPFLIHMIASGENSGRLDPMLAKAAHQQQQEVSNRLAVFMSLLEPLLILSMGLVVLVIVLAILQPIVEINQLVR